MAFYANIDFPLNFSDKDKKIYSILTETICDKYYRMIPSSFKKVIDIQVTTDKDLIEGGRYLGEAFADNIKIYLPTNIDGYEARMYSGFIAHELGHLALWRFYQNNVFANNLIHWAANLPQPIYMVDKTMVFRLFRMPLLQYRYFNLTNLIENKDDIMARIAQGQNKGPNVYW